MTTVNLGGYSDGWQDPANPIDLSGISNDGAWDLGTSGFISVLCHVASAPPPPGSYYRVDFQVYVVAYRGITSLPSMDTVGVTVLDPEYSQSTVGPDPGFPGATWEGSVWTGYVDQLGAGDLTFAIRAPVNNTSVVDTMEVFTKLTLVPEPTAPLLFAMSIMGWVLLRRR